MSFNLEMARRLLDELNVEQEIPEHAASALWDHLHAACEEIASARAKAILDRSALAAAEVAGDAARCELDKIQLADPETLVRYVPPAVLAAAEIETKLRRGIEEIIATYLKTEDTHGFVARLRRLLESVDAQYGVPPRAAEWRTDEPPRGVNLWVTIQRTADEREVAIARAAPKPHDNVWYSNGFWLMWKVIAWMPMTAPEPAIP